jgi:hypothetical protein
MSLFLDNYLTSILSILCGCTNRDQQALDALISKLGYTRCTAWYPNCGLDFRDLIELNKPHGDGYGKSDFPDLYIHTDYKPNWSRDVDPERPFSLGTVSYDSSNASSHRTMIREMYDLTFSEKIQVDYLVNSDFVDFPEDSLLSPKIFLLMVDVKTKASMLRRIPVIYFVMESINFIDQVVLKHKISITHMVKVREGCGFGGNRKSITIAYAFAPRIGFKYLFIDSETHTDFSLTAQLALKISNPLSCFDIQLITIIGEWSGFQVNLFRVDCCDDSKQEDDAPVVDSYVDVEVDDQQACPPALIFFAKIIKKISSTREFGRLNY